MSVQPHSLSSSEVESSVKLLDQAIQLHTEWLCTLHESIICKVPVPDDIIRENAHRLCALGRWYYSEASELLAEYPEFHEIEEIHRVMHDQARDVASRYQDEELISGEQYRNFIKSQQSLVGLLQNLKEKLLISLHSFDDLTGAVRREAFTVLASNVHAEAERNNDPYMVAMCDVDKFKGINDTYGHLAGDKVLQVLAQQMIRNVREMDCICRYGGEEFLLLLPQTKLDGAQVVLEKIRALIEMTPVEIEPGCTVSVTVSIGMADWEPGLGFEQVVRQADAALYDAKGQGRNRVCQWTV
jgi:diguanylate cyclase (GGDEF)-like protein